MDSQGSEPSHYADVSRLPPSPGFFWFSASACMCLAVGSAPAFFAGFLVVSSGAVAGFRLPSACFGFCRFPVSHTQVPGACFFPVRGFSVCSLFPARALPYSLVVHTIRSFHTCKFTWAARGQPVDRSTTSCDVLLQSAEH